MSEILGVAELGCRMQKTVVLQDISFCIEEGESVALLGANGAGKTTLLSCLLGLAPHEGNVQLFGVPRRREALRQVGVVFQNPEDQLFLATVLDDIALPLRNRGCAREEAAERARRSLAAVHLAECAERPAHRLSWGQRKRASIAAALALDPRLLVLDEPTSELDGRSVRELADVLNSLTATKLFSSHHLEFVRRAARRCLILIDGRLEADDTVEEVLSNRPLLTAAGLV